jgi:hypothetical protein
MITLTLRHYWSRFGWEIVIFWLISGSNSILLARNAPSWVMSAMAVLEIVALAWITVRLVLAEDGFQTSGGWRARPFPSGVRHGLPLVLAVAVVMAPVVLRAIVYHRMFEGVAVWREFGPGSLLWQLFIWFSCFVLPLKLFGLLILQAVDGRSRTAVWATLTLILLPIIALMGASFGKRDNYYENSGDNAPRLLAQGIQHELADATDFIGVWNDPAEGEDLPAVRLLARFSLAPDVSPPGIALRTAFADLQGSRSIVKLRALVLDSKMVNRLNGSIAVIRYADGTYATCERIATSSPGKPLPFFPATEWRFSGDFVSSLSLPEFEGNPRDLTHGLELYFFEPDWNLPRLPIDPTRARARGGREEVFRFSPTSIAELFTQFPWSDEVWEKTALPFLKNRATRNDLPFLLERLRSDPRLIRVFTEKNWTAEALPMLRQLAKERIPMGKDAVIALASEKDPLLAADLSAIALQLKSGLTDVESALRSQPGFDWPAFAKELWKRKKYTNNWLQPYGEFWQPALWAAQEGDFSAFRQTAEQAAQGKKWEMEQLKGLVAGEHADLLAYLRKNIDAMRFDPVARKWTSME